LTDLLRGSAAGQRRGIWHAQHTIQIREGIEIAYTSNGNEIQETVGASRFELKIMIPGFQYQLDWGI